MSIWENAYFTTIPCEDCQLELIAHDSLKEHIERKHNQTNVTWKHISDTNICNLRQLQVLQKMPMRACLTS